jgi:hypothetical protein
MGSLTIIPAEGQEHSDSSSTGQRKKIYLIPPIGWKPQEAEGCHEENRPKKKLAYEMTNEELAEHTRQEVIDHFIPKVPEKRVPIDAMLAAKFYDSLSNAAKR